MRKIIIAITSWPKRIQYVEKIIFNILIMQTVKADKVILTLATDEFPNKENDLPENLILLKNKLNNFEINWVKENTYAFKRFMPVIERYFDEDCWILMVDDDYFYKKDYVEFMVNTAEKYFPDCLTPGTFGKCSHGWCMIFHPSFFKNRSLFNLNVDEMRQIIASDSWLDAAILSNNISFKVVPEIRKYCKEIPRQHKLRTLYSVEGQRQKRRKFIKEKFIKMGYDLKNYPM